MAALTLAPRVRGVDDDVFHLSALGVAQWRGYVDPFALLFRHESLPTPSTRRWIHLAAAGRHRVYYLLLPLAALGLVGLRQRRFALLTLVGPVVLACASGLLAGGLVRYRHPAELSLVVVVGVGAAALPPGIARLCRRRR